METGAGSNTRKNEITAEVHLIMTELASGSADVMDMAFLMPE